MDHYLGPADKRMVEIVAKIINIYEHTPAGDISHPASKFKRFIIFYRCKSNKNPRGKQDNIQIFCRKQNPSVTELLKINKRAG